MTHVCRCALAAIAALGSAHAFARAVYINGGLNPAAFSASGVAAPGGAAWSELQAVGPVSNIVLGFAHQPAGNFRVADDFTVTDPGGWSISAVRFFAYQQTAGPPVPSITSVNVQIWNGRPGDPGSVIIFGDTVTNRLMSSTFSGMFRISNSVTPPPGTAPGTTRPIMADDCALSIMLPPGTYWLDWQCAGSLPSGPFAPAVTVQGQRALPGWNARVFNGTVWADAVDNGNPPPAPVTMDFPFEITYTTAPPMTTVEWAAPVSGFWNTPGNWNPAVVPNNMGMLEFDARILVAGAPYTVTLDVPVTVRSLDLLSESATLDLNNMPFTVEGDFRLSTTATLLAPFSGEFIVNGDAQLSGGTIMWLSNFTSNGRLLFIGSVEDSTDIGPTVEMCDSNVGHNGSAAKWSSSAVDGAEGVAPTILLNMGTVFTNGPASEFLIESDAVMNQQSLPSFTSTFHNQGVLRKQNSAGLTVLSNFNFNNTGTVEVASGTLQINGVPLPMGALQTGVWIARAGCALDFPSSSVRTNSADITLDGAASNFQALQALRTNAANANLRVRSGRSFVAQPSTLLLTNSGHFRPGPGSVIGVSGAMTLQGAGAVHIGVNGSGASAAHSGKITATGAMTFNGALMIELENGFTPDWGDSYTIATYASRSGAFSSFVTPALAPTLRWWKESNPTTYRVGVRHIADTNHDNVVNFADLNNVLSTFGQSGTGLVGDTDENGVVNFTDLNTVLSMYGQSAPPN